MVESVLDNINQKILDEFHSKLKSNPLYNYDINEINLAMINNDHKFSELFDDKFKKSNISFFDFIDKVVLNMANQYYGSITGKEKYEMIIYPIIICLFRDDTSDYKNILKLYFDKILHISNLEDSEDRSSYNMIEFARLLTILTHFGIIADKIYLSLVFDQKEFLNSHKYIFSFVKRIIKSFDSKLYNIVNSVSDKHVTAFFFLSNLFNDLYKVENTSKLSFPINNYQNCDFFSKLNIEHKMKISNYDFNLQNMFFEEFIPFHQLSRNIYEEDELINVNELQFDDDDNFGGLF